MCTLSRIKWLICLFSQIVGVVEATRYPLALGAAIVAVLLPGLVIFSFCFAILFVCCNWRRIPALRQKFGSEVKGAPVKAPVGAAYPHQPAVQYTKPEEDQKDNPNADVQEVKILVEPTEPQPEHAYEKI